MDTINFTRGVPANESFPIDEVIDAARAALEARGVAMLQYGPSLGFQPLREWLAEWQHVPVDRVMTSNGSLQLIEFLCLTRLQPGDVVFTMEYSVRSAWTAVHTLCGKGRRPPPAYSGLRDPRALIRILRALCRNSVFPIPNR